MSSVPLSGTHATEIAYTGDVGPEVSRSCAPGAGGGLRAQAHVGDVDGVLLRHQAFAVVGEVGERLLGPVDDHAGDVDAAGAVAVDDDQVLGTLRPATSMLARASIVPSVPTIVRRQSPHVPNPFAVR